MSWLATALSARALAQTCNKGIVEAGMTGLLVVDRDSLMVQGRCSDMGPRPLVTVNLLRRENTAIVTLRDALRKPADKPASAHLSVAKPPT